MRLDTPFLQRIARVAAEIAAPSIERLCDGLEQLPPAFDPANLATLTEGVAQPEVRSAVSNLLNAWRQEGRGVSPRELSWGLRAAGASDAYHRVRQTLEMVWSGPSSGASAFRRTDQALLELIQGAKNSILLVTFAAYKVPNIAAALVEAAGRGVKIALILESTEESSGAVTFNAIQALGGELARAATVYSWPAEKRGMDAKGNRGALHVKCAVADDEAVLISSANLTEHAMNLNMELGLLVRGGEIPRSLGDHLRSLVKSGVLASCNQNVSG